MKVSFYKDIADVNSKTVVTIEAYLKAIQTGKYKTQIQAVRDAPTKSLKTSLKKSLPNITASGTFLKRNDSSLILHSGLKQIDFDQDKNPGQQPLAAKALLIKDTYTFAAFISPSGDGVKLLVKISPAEDKEVYKHLEQYYKQEYNLNLDTSCSNVSKAMFVSYDADLYKNPDSTVFLIPGIDIKPSTRQSNLKQANNKQSEVELLIKNIEALKIDITATYADWVKIGFALATEFGTTGESYFLRISSLNPGYDAGACATQYKECCKQRKTGVAINTLFAIAKNYAVLAHAPGEQKQKPITKNLPVNGKESNKIEEAVIFYKPVFKTDDDGQQVLKDIKINYVKFIELLYSFGYRRYDIDKDFIYIQLKETVIKEVTVLQIQDYFFSYLDSLPDELSNGIYKKSLKEKIYNNPKNYFCDNRLSLLINKEPIVFNTDTKNECFIYYKNGFVKCNADGWELSQYKTLIGHVWQNQIINRDFKYFDIQELPVEKLSVYAQFLFNVSGKDIERFKSLSSLIGYLLHSYTEVKMKAIILTDSRISEEANGRTGKTLFGQTLKHIKRLTQINGKDFDATNRYKYQEASLDTQIVFLNDVRSNFRFETLYNDITEGITVEKKNQNPFTLKSKMCITTNKTITIEGSSSKDRCIEFEFANHYNELYSPEDEFKQRFFSDWDVAAWHQFDNFMMFCICIYLGNGIIEPQNVNLKARKLLDQTHPYFLEFINEKIKTGFIVSGKEICKQDLHNLFLSEYPELVDDKLKKRLETFTRWIKVFAKYSPFFDEDVQERKSMSKRYFSFKAAIH